MNIPPLKPAAVSLGRALRAARKQRKLTQSALAGRACLDLATVRNLEAGRGTLASLLAMLTALEHRFVAQPDSVPLGRWIAECRKMSGLSQQRLCERAGISKPSVIQIEREQGRVATLATIMAALSLDMALRPEGEQAAATPSLFRRLFIHGDCVTSMGKLDAASIHLVVTSPPYNIGKSYERKLSLDAYAAQARAWCAELPRLLTLDGALWINLGYTTPSARTTLPLTYLYHPILSGLGLHLVQEIVWRYSGGMAARHRFSPRSERWQWWVADPKRYRFDLDAIRVPPAAYDPRNNPAGKNPGCVWDFNTVVGGRGAAAEKTEHPCQFPIEMVERIIQACSSEGDTVLDPIGGSGMTALAAVRHGRGFVSIERDTRYDRISRNRMRIAAELSDSKAPN